MRKRKTVRLGKKLASSYLTIILLFSLFTCGTACVYIRQVYWEQEKGAVQNRFEQNKSTLESKITEYYAVANILAHSSEITDILADGPPAKMQEQYNRMLVMQSKIMELTSFLDLYQVAVYVEDDYFFSSNNAQFRQLSELKEYPAYESLQSQPAKRLEWIPAEMIDVGESNKPVPVLSFLRKLGTSGREPAGYGRISIRLSYLSRILQQIPSTEEAFVYLYDSRNGQMLCSNRAEYYESGELAPARFMEKQLLQNADWLDMQYEGQSWNVYGGRIRSTDWIMVAMVKKSFLNKDGWRMAGMWGVFALVFGCIAFAWASSFSRHIVSRIGQLEHNMERVRRGDLSRVPHQQGKYKDEVDSLLDYFEDTKEQIGTLMREKEAQSSELRRQELKILQEQINPHFLYNTLDFIHWKALDADAQEVADCTASMARYYRLSLGNGRAAVTLQDELSHIIYYVDIQNRRYGPRFWLHIDVPEACRGYMLPKITLQPLVENAILHGLRPKGSRHDGVVRIYVSAQEEEYLELRIEDNGVGMTPEMQAAALSRDLADGSGGYGVKNVNERLRMYFDESCGLRYESRPGEGTAVTIRIRKITEEV